MHGIMRMWNFQGVLGVQALFSEQAWRGKD
jgi:hypothetical protein